MTTLTFGKYKGSDVKDVPADYLEWGVERLDSPKWRNIFEAELNHRKTEEKEQTDWLKANLDNPESIEKLIASEIDDIEREIADSGCEREYSFFDVQKEAEKRAKAKLISLKAEKDLEALKIEYAKLLEVDLNMISKLENAYYNERLSRSNFQFERKYNLAMEYFKKKDTLLEILYGC